MLFCPCLVACELHADRETETVGGRVDGGGRLACIEKEGGGRLPGTWALTLTRPKTGGWALTREWALTRDTTVYIQRSNNYYKYAY